MVYADVAEAAGDPNSVWVIGYPKIFAEKRCLGSGGIGALEQRFIINATLFLANGHPDGLSTVRVGVTPLGWSGDTGWAMSQGNVKKLLDVYELLNTHFAALKAGEMDELLAFFDLEVVIETVDAPDPETYRGHDGVRAWFNDAFGPWAAVHLEAEDIQESGLWTVALLHTSLRGEASGVELELSTAAFHQFRGGRIVLDRVYLDRDEALEAFALKE